MRVLLQRVLQANVKIAGQSVASIERGLLLLAGFGLEDTSVVLAGMAKKIARLRIFSDSDDRLQFDVGQIKGAILAVPQFTLYAGLNKGRRPDFMAALAPVAAGLLFDQSVAALKSHADVPVAAGVFGADMQVSLVNDGPFTLMLESD